MGRDCHRLGGYGSDGGGGAISSSKSKKKANAANGCMAAFYHLFDFHHFYFPSHHHNLTTIDSPSSSKGLKLIQESPPSTTNKDKKSLNIPVRMRVRTETGGTTSSRLRALTNDTSTSSSEICNSPGSKTPSLVARLMGLDLLPDQTDLNHSLSDLHTTTHHGSTRFTSHGLSKKGTRSLPESPRISSARKSDFDIHRLSLQLNKESNNKHDEFGCSRLRLMKQDQDENRSPRDYARQIVKQIKERVVTRRVVGMDITNSVKNREGGGASQNSNEIRRDTTVSCSPRTRFSDKENKPSTIRKANPSSSLRPEQITQKPKPTTVILVSVSKASGEKQKQNKRRVKQRELRPINQCKKAESETRFSPRPMKSSPTPDSRNKRRGDFLSEQADAKATITNPLHGKKFKRIPKSSDLDNIFSATGNPQKQMKETVRGGLKSNEEASIFSTPIHKTEENSPQAAMNSKLGELCSDVPRYSNKRCPSPGEMASMDFDRRLLETKKLEEEGEEEEIVAEIERDIIDALVSETASELSRQTKTTSEENRVIIR